MKKLLFLLIFSYTVELVAQVRVKTKYEYECYNSVKEIQRIIKYDSFRNISQIITYGQQTKTVFDTIETKEKEGVSYLKITSRNSTDISKIGEIENISKINSKDFLSYGYIIVADIDTHYYKGTYRLDKQNKYRGIKIFDKPLAYNNKEDTFYVKENFDNIYECIHCKKIYNKKNMLQEEEYENGLKKVYEYTEQGQLLNITTLRNNEIEKLKKYYYKKNVLLQEININFYNGLHSKQITEYEYLDNGLLNKVKRDKYYTEYQYEYW